MQFNIEHIIYLAGIIDGEGSISVERHSPKKGRKYPTYYCRLTITNTSMDLMNWISKNFGGQIFKKNQMKSLGSKECYSWHAFGDNLDNILQAILPYAIVKKNQIKNAIEFRKTVGKTGQHVTDEMRDIRQSFYIISRSLNSPHNNPSAVLP